MVEKPCYYKHSCGYEICLMTDCPEYRPKKRGEPYLGTTPQLPSNADRIRGMSDEELADWIDGVLNEERDDWDVPGCYSCINYGTHHSDPANKGTYLYECAGCAHEGSHENGLKYGVMAWLQQPAKEEV